MKHFILVAACLLALGLAASAQTVRGGIEQLIALQSLGHTLRQGYQLVSTGLNTIGGVRADEFERHQAYVHSLDLVQPASATDEEGTALRTRLARLTASLRSTLAYWQNQPVLTQ